MFPFDKLNPFRETKPKRRSNTPNQRISQRKPKKQLLSSDIFAEAISEKIPAEAVQYCTSLWETHPFSFSISKTRSTCLGNYKFQNGHHTVSVNHDLNPYNFLITFIHEVAHQHVFIDFPINRRKRPAPHGIEWKTHFQNLLVPLLNESIFPPEILAPLAKHMQNPPASSTRDVTLMKALKDFDTGRTGAVTHLEDLVAGQSFLFKKRKFIKHETRRTRAMCKEMGSERKYTIPLMAEVSIL